MVGRFLILMATALLGSLFIEISMYHPIVAMERDPVAIVPGVAAALAICGGFLYLAFANRLTVVIFALTCCIAIVVGLLGTAIHLAVHASSIGDLATNAQAWLGNPPTLAPLSFAVGGCLGLVPLAWHSGIAPCSPTASRILEGIAAGAGLRRHHRPHRAHLRARLRRARVRDRVGPGRGHSPHLEATRIASLAARSDGAAPTHL